MRAAKSRTAIVIIAVAVVVGLLFSTLVIELGVRRSTEIGSARLGADILLLPSPLPDLIIYIQWKDPVFITPTNATAHLLYLRPSYIDYNATLDRQISTIPGITGVSPQVYVDRINHSGLSDALVGFDPATDFTILPWLKAAGQGHLELGPMMAVAGSGTGYAVGDTIAWRGASLDVVAVLEPTSSSTDNTVFFPIQTAYQLAQSAGPSPRSANQGQSSTSLSFKSGQISALLIKLRDNASEQQVGHKISSSLSNYVIIYGAIATKQVSLETRGIATYEFILAGLLGTSILILIASLMSMTINERKREFGLLRSIGATQLTISRIVMTEAGVVSLVGSLLGLLVGGAVLLVSETLLAQSYNISFAAPVASELALFLVGSLALGMLIGTAAATYPAYAAARMDPYEAMTRGE
jgi:putative ABC transport system permease protein